MNRTHNPAVKILLIAVALILTAALCAIGLFYYAFSIPEPEGLSLASWPERFTDNFSTWVSIENGNISIEEIGLERLDEYGLWLQILDETGREIFSRNKPDSCPTSYPASELLTIAASPYQNGETIFAGTFESESGTWGYLIGFPYAIGKHMLYYNGDHLSRLSPVIRLGILFALGVVFAFSLFCIFWLTRHLGKIAKGIEDVSRRSYSPARERGIFGGVYAALDRMDEAIRRSDELQEDTERTRREWIANITHDLKTPLSPIKGYGELLADGTDQTTAEYGRIILKNVDHTEKLINDLKLTYQLDSGTIPYAPRKVCLTRYLKEIVIDVMNDPAFTGREIEFESAAADLEAFLDPALFRRAVQNILINALTHNPADTRVRLTVKAEPEGAVIQISDNGVGLEQSELDHLFDRYYRGTNTAEKPEGSGLGLAIAKQIILLHGGKISVASTPGEGTVFTVSLPIENLSYSN